MNKARSVRTDKQIKSPSMKKTSMLVLIAVALFWVMLICWTPQRGPAFRWPLLIFFGDSHAKNRKETSLIAEIEVDALHRSFPSHVKSIQAGGGAEFSSLPLEK